MTDALLNRTHAYLPVWDASSDSENKIGFTRKAIKDMTAEEKAFVVATADLNWRNKEHLETCRKEFIKLIGENPF